MRALHSSAAKFVCALLPVFAHAENLLKNAGFEEPKVEARTDARKGGSPIGAEADATSWAHFQSMDPGGKVSVGVTNEIARTGRQSIFVQFDKAGATAGAFLMTELLPVKAEEKYRVSLWGRVDRKRPLTLDQGRPYMQLEVEFYAADQATQIGDAQYRTQMIPGMADRLLFISSKWNEYYAELTAPEDAEFMKITFHWESPRHEEAADGVIYFDDAAVDGVPGKLVPSLDPPAPVPAPEPAAAPTPAAPAIPAK